MTESVTGWLNVFTVFLTGRESSPDLGGRGWVWGGGQEDIGDSQGGAVMVGMRVKKMAMAMEIILIAISMLAIILMMVTMKKRTLKMVFAYKRQEV